MWIQPKWPGTDEPIKKLPNLYTTEEYSSMKNNEMLSQIMGKYSGRTLCLVK